MKKSAIVLDGGITVARSLPALSIASASRSVAIISSGPRYFRRLVITVGNAAAGSMITKGRQRVAEEDVLKRLDRTAMAGFGPIA